VVWNSWHLHLGSMARSLHDRVLTEVVGPVVESVDERPWFFIRYWQRGPHVRLRIGDLAHGSRQRLETLLRERLALAGALATGEEPLAEADYRTDAGRHAAGERGTDRIVGSLRAPGVYRDIYEPEFDRYGGPALMARTEWLFQCSSELVLALLPHLRTTRQRALLAIRATMSAAVALGGGAEQAYFYQRGMAAWRAWAIGFGYSAEQIDRLCAAIGADTGAGRLDPGEHGAFEQWHAELARLAEVIRATTSVHPGRIVASHVHMLHNRLGINPLDELRTFAWLAGRFPLGDLRVART
jgi:thiopeptide-type bacteriocin biosynthesis protein